jgi:hypothetical protein
MTRFTIPRVAHCSDGCRSQSSARPKTAGTMTGPPVASWGFQFVGPAGGLELLSTLMLPR